ncbi:MAG: phosphoserine transaminase [Pseudomonadota bacterium]
MTIKSEKPQIKPENPCFSSGPCAKRPGWSVGNFNLSLLGRSHRAKEGKTRLQFAIDKTKQILQIPESYQVGIVPASNTGAFEMAMWSLLGERGIDVLAWESFGKGWVNDIIKQLQLKDVRIMEADYGDTVNLQEVDNSRDIVFTWNGTTSGVRVPNGDWISDQRNGLTLCDATSAAFAQDLAWGKLDVTTFSWQKVLGGEAQHGIIVLSPRAIERLESYTPLWPLPKIFRMTKNGKVMSEIFSGSTINTPSMLCVEDYIDALTWAEQIGGLSGLFARANGNFAVIEDWVERTPWIGFLAQTPEIRSNTSVCLRIVDADITQLPQQEQATLVKKIVTLLDDLEVAKDIGSYRDAPAGLRIWTGATIEQKNLETLLPWLDWAYDVVKSER